MVVQITMLCYALATLWQGSRFFNKSPSSIMIWIFGCTAVSLHAYLLYTWIDISNGQNLYFFNVLSLVLWMSSVLILISSIFKPVNNLLIFIFPLALLSIFLVSQFPGFYLLNTRENIPQFFHIIFATLTISVLAIAVFQAVLLAIQDKNLRAKRAGALTRLLPPLETLEKILFEIITLGFLLLTIVIVLSWIFYSRMYTHPLTHSPYLVIVAWIIFAILLCGRYFFNWRGKIAIHWTIMGSIILILSYFGSWLLPKVFLS